MSARNSKPKIGSPPNRKTAVTKTSRENLDLLTEAIYSANSSPMAIKIGPFEWSHSGHQTAPNSDRKYPILGELCVVEFLSGFLMGFLLRER
jgi:hypothetical protein